MTNRIDVINARISDHHPIVHAGVLFWNIMMQGKMHNKITGKSYNNGFGMIETDQEYITRLGKIVKVIAELVQGDPEIEVISLCEGPIQLLHTNAFARFISKYPGLRKFNMEITIDQEYPSWGLIMLIDAKYRVAPLQCDLLDHSVYLNKLINRFQLWELTCATGKCKYIALGHFPFAGDERVTNKEKLSVLGKKYCHLVNSIINKYTNQQFILCADFNLNPFFISEYKNRELDSVAINNSIVLKNKNGANDLTSEMVTVDGILLSQQAKCNYSLARSHLGLFARLKNEAVLLQAGIKDFLIQNRHAGQALQRMYDEHFGLTPVRTSA